MASPNRDLGPCRIEWNGLVIVKTFGSVFFLEETRKQEIFEDQQGELPVDRVTKGKLVSVTVPMTRYNLDQLAAVTDGATVAGGGTKLVVKNVVGDTEYYMAKELIIKPLVDGVVGATSEWIHLRKAYPTTNYNQPYDNAGQRVVDITFNGYPDDESPWVHELWRMGPS